MNEYSKELMHMTTSEKADYNRRYYQRNKQYWKDYYKTGHGRGRSTAVLSGTRNNGKTLDNERHEDRVLEYTDKFVTARKQHNYKDAAMYRKLIDMNAGDIETDSATRDAARNGANRPRTVNIEKTVGVALKSALTRSVRSIKSNANKAMKFIESLFK